MITQSKIQQLITQKKDKPKHLLEQLKRLGIAEAPLGSNWGDSVGKWSRQVGFRSPVPWCGNAQAVTCLGLTVPAVFSGSAAAYAVKGYSYRLSDVIYGNYIPKPGDWRVKTRKGGHHVDCFVEWDTLKQEGKVIGGNVSDAWRIRKVTLRSMIADGTTHITDVKERIK